MSINCSFIGGGCNALYSAIGFCHDSRFNNLVAYPCANQVRALLSLSCFEKRVNSVKFLNIGQILSLVAVSGDGKIGLWQLQQDEWQLMYQQKICNMSLIQVNVLQDEGKNSYFILLGIDGIVRVLDQSLNQMCLLEFGANVMECVDSVYFMGQLIIALSGQDRGIHIYELYKGEKFNLEYKCTLSGHSRNVNGLAFKIVDNYILLASGGKDGYIRIWKMIQADVLQGDLDSENKKGYKNFKLLQSNQYIMKLESVLQGHTEEVSSLVWYSKEQYAKNEQELILLSSSFDYNIILWVQDIQTGVWCTSSRLGQMQGNKNQFFGLSMSACGNYIIAHTYDGGIYLWNRQSNADVHYWKEMPTITGHYSQVTDLDVGLGDYMVTCSQDQTSRVWCKWVNNYTWNEVGRPQVHGYDLTAIKFLHREDGCMEDIVSGGDEKVLRIFTPSPSTVNYINFLSNNEVRLRGNVEYSIMKKQIGDRGIDVRVYKIGQDCISQPLGLMNKQVGGIVDAEEFEGEPTNYIAQIDQEQSNEIIEDYNMAPTQSYLSARGLWPEQNKLYGHGYEIVSIATYKNLIASSCRSTSEDAAQIIIWDSKACKIISQLKSHTFSVVQMQFSKNGTYLISASKDRTISLFQKQIDGNYKLQERCQQAQRIIYTLSIDPSNEEQFVISGSRDKKLRGYLINNGLKKILEKNMPNPITASELILIAKQKYLLVLGFDSGDIRIYELNFDQDKSEINLFQLCNAADNLKHNLQVNKIKLLNHDNENHIIHIASCSDDHTVRVFDYNYKL